MVLNQRQVLVIISDWEPYLGSLFCVGFCGWLSLSSFVCSRQNCFGFFHICCFLFCSVHVLSSLLNMMNTNHAALWSSPSSTDESRYTKKKYIMFHTMYFKDPNVTSSLIKTYSCKVISFTNQSFQIYTVMFKFEIFYPPRIVVR
jgi:hypothetical protein